MCCFLDGNLFSPYLMGCNDYQGEDQAEGSFVDATSKPDSKFSRTVFDTSSNEEVYATLFPCTAGCFLPFYLFHSCLEGRLYPQTRLHFESEFFFEHAIIVILQYMFFHQAPGTILVHKSLTAGIKLLRHVYNDH